MAKTKQEKQEIIKNLEKSLDDQKIMIFANFKGIKNKNFSSLRSDLKSVSSNLTVAKKTLMNKVFENKKINISSDLLKGETAIVFGFGDQTSPAKKVYEFSRNNPEIGIIGGFLDGEFRTTKDIIELAKLPSREILLAKLVGTVQAPIVGLTSVLQGNIKGLVRVLSQIKN
jgi:large subunit ribosomal protein L10